MKKYLIPFACMLLTAGQALAGGLLTNTNHHIAFARMMARGASTEIDAIYTNPAGTAFMAHNGWTLSVNNQSAFQTRNVLATIESPILPGGRYEHKYEGEAVAPIIPSLYAAYKTDRWAASLFFGITGGGGKCTYNHGLPMFDAAVMAGLYSQSAQLLQQYPQMKALISGPITPAQYNLDSYMRGRQFVYGGQLGFAYKFNKHFSGYAGLRLNYFTGNYRGHVNATAKTELATAMMTAASAVGQTNPALSQMLVGMSGENGLAHVALDCDQTGFGVTPILGLDYKVGGLTLAAKYEFKTNLKIENDTKVLEAPAAFEGAIVPYKDGVNTPYDLPSILYLAAGYEFIPGKFRGTVEYHYYGDKWADMADKRQKALTHGTHEYLAGLEWDINKIFTVSAGGQITDYGLSDEFQTQTAFSCDSYSIGFGGAVNLSRAVRLNVGYFWTTYSNYTKKMPADKGGYQGISEMLPGQDVYSRTNKVLGIGVDIKF